MVATRQRRSLLTRTWPWLLVVLAGCRSLPPQPPIDFSGPGWSVQEGQAIWKSAGDAPGVAGDLLVATHQDGRQVVRFSKGPLPFLDAQRTTNFWQLRVAPTQKSYSGRGAPPARVFWLQLPEALAGNAVPAGWRFQAKPDYRWTFENKDTGEGLAGFLEPASSLNPARP